MKSSSANKKSYDKRMRIINKVTNNGACWWLHQILTYNPRGLLKGKSGNK